MKQVIYAIPIVLGLSILVVRADDVTVDPVSVASPIVFSVSGVQTIGDLASSTVISSDTAYIAMKAKQSDDSILKELRKQTYLLSLIYQKLK